MPKTLNVGMVGYGFMGKAHSNAYLKVNRFFPEFSVYFDFKTITKLGMLLHVALDRWVVDVCN